MGLRGLWALLPPLLLLLLLLLTVGPPASAQVCPPECQCSQPRTAFCVSGRSQSVPQGLPPETSSLYLFENGIRALNSESFGGLPPALQLLDLSQNQVGVLPRGLFGPLPALRNLDLSANRLQEVTNESFHGLHLLERLYLDRNRIQSVQEGALDALETLLELKLQDNRLQAWPPLRLPALLLLDLSHNPLTAAPEPHALQGVPSLESLKAAGLGLEQLDEGLLHGLGSLHELDLSHNHLEAVPSGALRELPALTKLSLAGNVRITRLRPEDFQDLGGLQELDLSDLRLTALTPELLGAFPRLTALAAAQNPFNCLCPMAWLVAWLGEGKASLRRPEETRCHFPPKNAGRTLLEMRYADFGCPTTTTTTARTTTQRATTAEPEPATSSFTSLASSTLSSNGSPSPTPSPFPEAPLCPLGTCLNGGTCHLGTGHHLECLCLPGFAGLFCESEVRATTTTASLSIPANPSQMTVKALPGGTSLNLDLQGYVRAKPWLKGLRLTYWSLSGPERRPLTLKLPASLPDYTLRALRPNASYQLCLGPLGDREEQEEPLCAEARTLPLARKQQQQQQGGPSEGEPPLDLAVAVVPAAAAILLLVSGVAAISFCVRRRRKQQRSRPSGKEGGQATLGPLEMEGVTAGPLKALSTNGLDHQAPLISGSGATLTPQRPQRPSYF